jgi:hypothetical protein
MLRSICASNARAWSTTVSNSFHGDAHDMRLGPHWTRRAHVSVGQRTAVPGRAFRGSGE